MPLNKETESNADFFFFLSFLVEYDLYLQYYQGELQIRSNYGEIRI